MQVPNDNPTISSYFDSGIKWNAVNYYNEVKKRI